MTTPRQTICLCMIVRNEAPVIRRCLASVRPLIDTWFIVDTGSTDGTQAAIQAMLIGLPGHLVSRPWQDFAHNRSEALALARPLADYTLIIDADDTLEPPPGFEMPPLDQDSYDLPIHDNGITYRRTQLVRNTRPWAYRGVLHEFITCPDAAGQGSLPLVMRRNHDGARRRNPNTYRNDAAILQTALQSETDPLLIARYTFYLAQSLRDAGQPDQAIAAYLARAEMGFWADEVFISLYNAATLMASLSRPEEDILALYARATEANPARNEARHAASHRLRLAARYQEGAAIAAPGLDLAVPPDGLFVEPWIYDRGLRDEYAVNAYWAGLYGECLDACLILLARPDLPQDDRERIAANARFARERLAAPKTPWAPATPQGGTELMEQGLRQRLGPALDAIDLRLNTYADVPPGLRPLVVWIHHHTDQPAIAWLHDPSAAARVDWFVFVSDWQRTRFIEAFHLRPERCVTLRNATAVPSTSPIRTPGAKRRLAYTSTPYRGLSVLLDAWDQLRPTDAELHIWSSHKLYGPAADDTPYQPLWIRAAALPGVTHHGIVPNTELRAALQEIDILAYPSTFPETSCLAVIEAMAAGCRILCPDLGALAETTDGFARLYAHTPDPVAHAQDFAALLAAELAHPWAHRPTRAAEQHAMCQARYDWPVRLAEWQAFIGRVTDTPK